MPFSLLRLQGPSREVLTLDEVKAQGRISTTADDSYIETILVPAARSYVELYLNRALLPQKWRLTLDRFPGSWPYTYGYGMVQSPRREIHIPLSPLISIDAFKYPDPTTLAATDVTSYQLVKDAEPPRLQPAYGTSWPSAAWTVGDIHIDFTVGYLDSESSPVVGSVVMPPEFKLAMLLLVGHWYNNREASMAVIGGQFSDIPFGVDALLSPHRMWDYAPVADNWGRFAR